jgi:preprotein translocase subunit SecG
MVYYLISTIYVLACLLLLMVVLLQQGKGGDIASAFGGGSSQTAFGARAGATVLSKATAILAVVFMMGALTLALMGRGGGRGSLMGGTDAPPAAVETPATPPANTAPGGTTPAAPAATEAPSAPAVPDAPQSGDKPVEPAR